MTAAILHNPRVRRLLVAAFLAAAPLLAQQEEFPKRIELRGVANLAQVSPVLYRGAQPNGEGFRNLRELGVRTVLSMRSAHDDRRLLGGLGLYTFRIPAHQWHPESQDVLAALKLILTPNFQPVFVHCQAGKDRTGLVVAAYEVLELGKTVEQAVAERRSFGAWGLWAENEAWLQRLKNPSVRDAFRKMVEKEPLPAVVRVP